MTPEQLQKELKELLSNRNDDGDLDTSGEEFEALIAKAFLAGEKSGKGREAEAWLLGKRCDNCGKEMERDPISTMCAMCWEEE